MRKIQAFTLIELLVVISIIALLASIILASLNTSRAKSRDARRVSDIKEIQLALELYYNDNAVYPGDIYAIGAGALSPTYISTVPTDPSSGSKYGYVGISSAANGTCISYHLGATLEATSNVPGSSLATAANFDSSQASVSKCAGNAFPSNGAGTDIPSTVTANNGFNGGSGLTKTIYDVRPQ